MCVTDRHDMTLAVKVALILPKQQILDSSKLADDNFELNKYGRKFSKCVENTVGKGKIACYEQFILFPVF